MGFRESVEKMRAIFLAAFVVAAAVPSSHAWSKPAAKPDAAKPDHAPSSQVDTLVGIVRDHIASTRGWRANEYAIESVGRENDLAVYKIVHKNVEKPAAPGGEKSFQVVVDPKTRQVMGELLEAAGPITLV
jgi:hypothetical protein